MSKLEEGALSRPNKLLEEAEAQDPSYLSDELFIQAMLEMANNGIRWYPYNGKDYALTDNGRYLVRLTKPAFPLSLRRRG